MSLFVRSICCPKLPACEPALPSHFISHHCGFGAGKIPELRTVARHWFRTPLRQLWGGSSSWPAPLFRKGKVSSGGCSTTAAHSEQFLWGEESRPGPLNDDLKFYSSLPSFFPHLSHSFASVLSDDVLAPPEGVSTLPSASSSPAFPPC